MSKAGWKIDEDDKATFIDLEDDENALDPNHVFSQWCELPDLVLEKIFAQLPLRYRYYSSLVCRNWYRAFTLSGVWSHFVFTETSLTRGKFNYYSGWQYVLDHLRTSVCLAHIGRHFRRVTFLPMTNFHNVYEFMNIMSWFIEQRRINTKQVRQFESFGKSIRAIKYTFPCNIMSDSDQTERIRLFGTGGKLLEAIKRLILNIEDLQCLELINLMLNQNEALHLLDEICMNACETLRVLALLNVTQTRCPLIHIGVFVNLNVLLVSPQTINEEIIEMLGETNLTKLYLVQNRYTQQEGTKIASVSQRAWLKVRKMNPLLRVYLELESKTDREIVIQDGAPVCSVLYDSPMIKADGNTISLTVLKYSSTLETYGHKQLPRFHMAKSFGDRPDSHLIYLSGQCQFLHTLIIRERISTSSLLLIATQAKNLRLLYVRKNAVILRNNWPKEPGWTDDFHEWLQNSCKSYDVTEREISKIFGYRWRMLTDYDFKRIPIHVHSEGY